MIELVETFKIVPIFCEYFRIFLNKIVFEMVFEHSPKSTTRYKDMLFMIRFLSACCIFCAIWRRSGRLEKNDFTPKTDQKWDRLLGIQPTYDSYDFQKTVKVSVFRLTFVAFEIEALPCNHLLTFSSFDCCKMAK